jgi:hypothetical protein
MTILGISIKTMVNQRQRRRFPAMNAMEIPARLPDHGAKEDYEHQHDRGKVRQRCPPHLDARFLVDDLAKRRRAMGATGYVADGATWTVIDCTMFSKVGGFGRC